MDDPARPGDEGIESADFAPVRVGGRGARRLWSLGVAAAWLAVVGAVVGAGVLGRSGTAPGDAISATGGPAAHAMANPPANEAAAGPTRPSNPDLVALHASTDATGIRITGTVLAREVVWVFMSIQDLRGGVITWRSLSVEDPDGGIRPNKTPAFDVHIDLAPRPGAAAIVIEVNAYDNLGREIGSVGVIVGGPTHPAIHLRTELTR